MLEGGTIECTGESKTAMIQGKERGIFMVLREGFHEVRKHPAYNPQRPWWRGE